MRRSPLILLLALCWAGTAMAQQRLVIETEPAGAAITLDGEGVGTAPLELDVAPGRYRVQAGMRGFDSRTRDVYVASGEAPTRVRLVLPPVSGRLRVEGLSQDARVLLDGVPLEEDALLREGSFLVRVEDGSKTAMALVEVKPESETVVSYSVGGFDPSVLFRGALVPGGVQFTGGRPVVGALFVGGMGATALVGASFHRLAQQADRDLEAGVERYDRAGSENEVNAALAEIDAAHERSVRHRQYRTAALGAVLVVYVASVFDASVNHGRIGTLRVKGIEPARISVAPTASGVALRFSL